MNEFDNTQMDAIPEAEMEQPIPESPDLDPKAEKFKTVATQRVNKLCHSIIVLGNLSNRSSYHYTEEQVNVIFDAIEEQVRQTRAKFNAPPEAKTEFIHL